MNLTIQLRVAIGRILKFSSKEWVGTKVEFYKILNIMVEVELHKDLILDSRDWVLRI